MSDNNLAFMQQAIEQAQRAWNESEIPIGCVILDASGTVIARGHNQKEQHHDPTAHAEIQAIRAATKALSNWRLSGCTLAVTLEPCPMCLSAIIQARVARLIFGAYDPVMGACGSKLDLSQVHSANPTIEIIGGVMEAECRQLIDDFWATRRG